MGGIKRVFSVLVLYYFLISPAFALLFNEELCTSKGYTWLEESDYPATYSFTDDIVGSAPSGWTVSSPASTYGEIIKNYYGHNNVFKIDDQSTSDIYSAYNSFSAVSKGSLEVFMLKDSVSDYSGQLIIDDGGTGYQVDLFFADDGNIKCYDGSWNILMSYNPGEWYHVRVDFDTDSDTSDFYIDGFYRGSCNFKDASSGLTRVKLNSGSSGGTGVVYFDAVGYSWDPDYHIGDNMMGGCCGDDLVDLRSGLVSEWHFDESSGNNAPESIGSNDGILYNMDDSDWVSGQYGNALDFDGSNDYVQIPNAEELNPSSITISAWVKTSASQTDQIISKDAEGSDRVWQFRMDSDGVFRFIPFDDSGSPVSISSTSIINDGNWHFVTATADSNLARVYVDGVMENSVSFSGMEQGDINSVLIGRSENADPGYFTGLIDEARIYNRALSLREVNYLYDNSAYDYYNYSDIFSSSYSGYCYLNNYYSDLDDSSELCGIRGHTYLSKDWWNTAWNNRKNFTVIEQSGTTLTDYQVSINPNTYNTSGLVASYHFSEETSNIKDYSGENNYGTLYSSTVGLWHFDENTGNLLYDSTSFGNDGSIIGASWNSSGVSGSSLSFDGTDDYISIPDNNNLEFSAGQSFSLSFWYKDDFDQTTSDGLVTKGYHDTSQNCPWYQISLISSDVAQFVMRDSGCANTESINGNTVITDGLWHHVVAVRDSENDELRLYVDGESDAAPVASSDYSVGVNTDSLVLMNHYDRYTSGQMDEVAVYDKALSSDEVNSLYYSRKSRFIEYSEGYGGKGIGLEFDGVDDYVEIPGNDFYNLATGSIVSWIKPYGGQVFISHLTDSSNNRQFNINSVNNGDGTFDVRVTAVNDAGNVIFVAQTINYFNLDEWHQIIYTTQDGSGNFDLFVDGNVQSMSFSSGSETDFFFSDAMLSTDDLQLGAKSDANYIHRNYFEGIIDEVKISSDYLTSSEVLELYHESKGRYDYSDLRFFDDSGNELNYYHEYDDIVWIKIPELPASSSKNITMYYNNPGANSKSSGDNTFVFFDDFNDEIFSDEWVVVDPTWSQAGGYLRGTNGWSGGITVSNPPSLDARVMKSVMRIASAPNSYAAYSIKWGDGNNFLHSELRNEGTDVIRGHAQVGGSWQTDHNTIFGITENEWYDLTTKVDGSGNVEIIADGTTNSFTDADWDQVWKGISLHTTSGTVESHFDNIYVREYAGTEPSVTEGFSERVYEDDSGIFSYYSFDSDMESVVVDSVSKNHGLLYGSTVGLWHFDENAGSTAFDATVYNNNGYFGNDPSWNTGIIGSALDFDGGNDYVQASDSSSLDFGTNSFSVTGWVKPLSIGSLQIILSKRYGTSTIGYEVYFRESGALAGLIQQEGTYASSTDDGVSLNQDEWNHFAVVFDHEEHKIKRYLNSNPTGIQDSFDNSIDISNNDAVLTFGRKPSGVNYFNGKMDEIAVYEKALTSDEIKYLYYSQRAEFMDYSKGYEGKKKSISFDGVDDYINFGNIMDFNDDWGLSFWYKSSDTRTGNGLSFMGARDGDNGWQMHIQMNYPGEGHLHLQQYDGSGYYIDSGDVNANDGEWHHVALFQDTTSSKTELYFDGELVGSERDGNPSIDDDFNIGRRGGGGGSDRYINAVIDEVRIYERALSAGEIMNIYESEAVNYGCCGDDYYYDTFYNNSIGATSHFCQEGYYEQSRIDHNQTICEYYSNNWVENVNSSLLSEEIIFPATYTFTNDIVGSAPSGWTSVSNALVIKSYDNYHKVVEFNNTSGNAGMTLSHGGKNSGSFEFWYKTTNITSGTSFVVSGGRDSYPYRMWRLEILDGRWYSNSDNTVDDRYLTEISDPEPNKWYHISIHWRNSNAGEWQGLSTNRWKVVINGEESNQLRWNKDWGSSYSPEKTFFTTYQGDNKYDYVDAVGVSWDSDYDVGDNELTFACCGDDAISDDFYNGSIGTTSFFCSDGLFVNEEIDVNNNLCMDFGFEWFSGLISGSNGSCCGDDDIDDSFYNGTLNTTSFFCSDGLFVNEEIDVNQNICEYYDYSWIKNFNPDSYSVLINVSSTFSFTDDIVGSVPDGWTSYSGMGYLDATVVSGVSGLAKVLEFDDPGDPDSVALAQVFSDGLQNNGTVQFYIRTDDADSNFNFLFLDSGFSTFYFNIGINNSEWQYDSDSDSLVDTPIPGLNHNPENNEWHHLTVHFRGSGPSYQGLSNNEFKVIVDNDYESSNVAFLTNGDPEAIFAGTLQDDGPFKTYIDGLGYSWDDDYVLGKNTYYSCCGDDDFNFYNGSIGTTSFFCSDGLFVNEEIDVNNNLCMDFGFEWVFGTTNGSYPQCCGDDESIDDFYNSSSNCISGMLYYCGVDDGVCPENGLTSCSPSDPDCAEPQTPDNNPTMCEDGGWTWFTSYTAGNYPYCCGNNNTDDDFLGNTDCCYNGEVLSSGSIQNSLYCYRGVLYDCNDLINDAQNIENNVFEKECHGNYYCTINGDWDYTDNCEFTDVIIGYSNTLMVETRPNIGALNFTITNPSTDSRDYKLVLTTNNLYARFTINQQQEMIITIPPGGSFSNFIDVFPLYAGQSSIITLEIINLNNPSDSITRQFNIQVSRVYSSRNQIQYVLQDEKTVFDLLIDLLTLISNIHLEFWNTTN